MEREQAKALSYKRESAYSKLPDKSALESFCVGYRDFIDNAKTERLACVYAKNAAEKAGFSQYVAGDKLKAGDRVYYVNRDKSIFMAVIGKKPLDEGCDIIASHIDSPRLDLKALPLYENSDICYFKTRYYGGLKKYQWTALPLALHGVVCKKNGEKVEINIGEDESDPVFYISDLMPHIGKDQMAKTMSEGITGETLNIICGSLPFDDEEGTKTAVMALLNEKYGIEERDFMTADLTAVPAQKSREVGFDRSMIAAYGHDDRICGYPAMQALFDTKAPEKTCIVFLADREEIGSYGVTGLTSAAYINFIKRLCDSTGADKKSCAENSCCLSGDVGGAYDPSFADAYEENNAAKLGCGVAVMKYTGGRGKSGCSEARAEFISRITRAFDQRGISWQTGEYGKNDQGGAGTVASEIAVFNIEVLDAGVPILSMHSPVELASKTDIYEMFRASKAFFELV